MPPGIYRLPLELVRKVAAESRSRDLAALALTGRHFHAWVNPCLYEHNIKHEGADAAVWAASYGRLDTLLLLRQAETLSSAPFVNKIWEKGASSGRRLPFQWFVSKFVVVKFTLLHLAVQRGHDDMVVWLLQHGADINAHSLHLCGCERSGSAPHSWTPLHIAICCSRNKTVKLLLAHNASFKTSERDSIDALHTAAAKGRISTIHQLSKVSGFNPNVKDNKGRVPLHYAITTSKGLRVIQALLDAGADVEIGDDRGPSFTPLCASIAVSNFKAAVILLEAGAKFLVKGRRKAQIEQQSNKNISDFPLLHVASIMTTNSFARNDTEKYRAFQRKVIRKLLDSGLRINQKLSRNAAQVLGYELMRSRPDISPRLSWRTLHADIEGMTPLMMAVRHRSDPSIVRLLLERGSKVNLLDKSNISALRYAAVWDTSRTSEKNETIKALLEHGADLLGDSRVLNSIIKEDIRITQEARDVIIENMGPENLDKLAVPQALRLCCLFGRSRIYNAIKRITRVELSHGQLRDVLEDSLGRHCTSRVVDFLVEVSPRLSLEHMLAQWRSQMSAPLVNYLEEMRGY